MKNLRKGFTLVEMLIVVVIIGILATALLPKMMGAQDLARDAGRLVALRDLGTALSSYQAQKGEFPFEATASSGYTYDLSGALVKGGYIKEIPADPVKNNSFAGFVDAGTTDTLKNSYQYAYLKRNGLDNAAVALVASVQTDGNANYVVSASDSKNCRTTKITEEDIFKKDVADLKLCKTVTAGASNTFTQDGACIYADKACLRYVLIQ